MNNKHVLTAILLAAIANSTVSAYNFEDISLWWKGKEEEVVSHEHLLTPNAHISVENPKGTITISTWKQNKIMLEATKTGSEKSVKNTKIDLTYTKDGLSIKTVNIHPDDFCKVSLSLIVPVDAVLESVKTDRGNIIVKNCSTPLSITSNYGDVFIEDAHSSANVYTKHGLISISTTDTLTKENKIVAFTEKGAITLQVPETTNAHLYATTLRGHVSTEQPVTLDKRTISINTKNIAQFKRDVQGCLGSGQGPTFKLHTNKGNIKVAVS